MADTTAGVEPRPNDAGNDADVHTFVHDTFNLAPRRTRDKVNYIHPEGYEDGANVWRFVIAGEAFTTQDLTQDQLMNEVDRVFLGETHPLLPVVTYEWVSINDEVLDSDGDPLDTWEDDGGLIP
jgi:hypothetical protein